MRRNAVEYYGNGAVYESCYRFCIVRHQSHATPNPAISDGVQCTVVNEGLYEETAWVTTGAETSLAPPPTCLPSSHLLAPALVKPMPFFTTRLIGQELAAAHVIVF